MKSLQNHYEKTKKKLMKVEWSGGKRVTIVLLPIFNADFDDFSHYLFWKRKVKDDFPDFFLDFDSGICGEEMKFLWLNVCPVFDQIKSRVCEETAPSFLLSIKSHPSSNNSMSSFRWLSFKHFELKKEKPNSPRKLFGLFYSYFLIFFFHLWKKK